MFLCRHVIVLKCAWSCFVCVLSFFLNIFLCSNRQRESVHFMKCNLRLRSLQNLATLLLIWNRLYTQTLLYPVAFTWHIEKVFNRYFFLRFLSYRRLVNILAILTLEAAALKREVVLHPNHYLKFLSKSTVLLLDDKQE